MPPASREKRPQPRYDAVELAVLRKVTPPKRLPPIVASTIAAVERAIKSEQVLASVRIGGSIAKATYLRGDHDIDVFVRFSQTYDNATLADRLARILTVAFGTTTNRGARKLSTKSRAHVVERVHGSRDYFHVRLGAFLFEFIPVLQIDDWREAVNVTDMSPLHVDYVASHTKASPWLSNDIRLTKQFCKAAKIYGAESYIGGFSGHVVDLLNIYYGGFRALLHAASSWSATVVIDPEHHHENPLLQLNGAKTKSPLIIVDPVQPDRNSAAAVGMHAYRRLREVAREYLAATPKARAAFFVVKPLSLQAFRSTHKGLRVLAITLDAQKGKQDVIGAKCFKVYEHCVQQFITNGFTLAAHAWEFDNNMRTPQATILFAIEPTLLSAEAEIAGPPSQRVADVARFRAAHSTMYSRAGRVFALERRKYRDSARLLAVVLRDKYVLERVQRATFVVLDNAANLSTKLPTKKGP